MTSFQAREDILRAGEFFIAGHIIASQQIWRKEIVRNFAMNN